MKRLAEIQQKLKAPKTQYNKFGEYHFRSCEDILESVKPLLGDLVLLLSDEIVQIGDRYYVKAYARLYDGTNILAETHAYARETKERKKSDESQLTGAASSYARKYALDGLFAIDDTKDADATNTQQSLLKKDQMLQRIDKIKAIPELNNWYRKYSKEIDKLPQKDKDEILSVCNIKKKELNEIFKAAKQKKIPDGQK